MKVEVEIEDLETIVFATAIIKTIETQLVARKQDPFIQPHLNYSKAHDALTFAMNSARRAVADTKVEWDGELESHEIKLLENFVEVPVFEVDNNYRKKNKAVDSLAAKGCLRIGQLVSGAVWPGEDRPDIKPVAGFALAITPRGQDKLQKALHAAKS